jgi:hypothetical protein
LPRSLRSGPTKCVGPPVGMTEKSWKLAAGDGADDEERFFAGRDFGREQGVRRFVRDILGAGEEAQEGAALQGVVIADGAAKHWVARFEFIEHGAQCGRSGEFKSDLAAHVSQRAEMRGEYDANHGSGGRVG